MAAAEADLRRARDLGGADALLNGLEHHAADRAAASDWPAALGCLDRVLAGRPDDWRLVAARAEALAGLGRSDEAAAEVDRAVRLGADWPYRTRHATAAARGGDWRRSAGLLRPNPDPVPPHAVRFFALASLRSGDRVGYARAAEALVSAASTEDDPDLAGLAAEVCAYGPGAADDRAAALIGSALRAVETRLSAAPGEERAGLDRRRGLLVTRAAVSVRAGRHAEAAAWLGPLVRDDPDDTRARLFLALSLGALGRTHEAAEHLARVSRRADTPDVWGSLELELLTAEAASTGSEPRRD
jgi:predicted Zn-dependent protease